MMINLNQQIKVQLTERGHEDHHNMWYNTFTTQARREQYPYQPPKEDANGWSTWMMWDFMRIFGPVMGMGCTFPVEFHIEVIEGPE